MQTKQQKWKKQNTYIHKDINDKRHQIFIDHSLYLLWVSSSNVRDHPRRFFLDCALFMCQECMEAWQDILVEDKLKQKIMWNLENSQ